MKTTTKSQIVEYIKESGQSSPRQITDFLKISSQAVHRQLKKLSEENKIVKIGSAPNVYYKISEYKKYKIELDLTTSEENFFEKNYLYISPQGKILYGAEGFKSWVDANKQTHMIRKLADEYLDMRKKYDEYFEDKIKMIEASKKFKDTFDDCQLDQPLHL